MVNWQQLGSVLLSLVMSAPGPLHSQEQAATSNQKCKLTVLEGASNFKRVKKGRVSTQAVVKVTDQNDAPVAGIVVAFTIPLVAGKGASFANSATTSTVTTNSLGVATSGMFEASASSSFSMSVTASVPGGAITTSMPVNMSAIAAGGSAGTGAGAAAGTAASTGGGISGALLGAIIAVGAAAAVGGTLAVTRGDKGGSAAMPTTPRATITIGVGGPTYGPPR